MLTAAQLRAARGLLGWSRTRLSRASGVDIAVIRRMERDQSHHPTADDNLVALVRVLEAAGVVFVDADSLGEGVRLSGM